MEGLAVNEVILGVPAGGCDPVGCEIVSAKVAWPVPPLFVALSATDEVPDADGVPEINPAALIDKPAGSPVAAKLVGELEAVV